jgi:type I restriction enzyme S subunit
VRTLTLTAVTNGVFGPENAKITTADSARVADLWLEPGDILVQRSNTPELVGTTRRFPGPSGFAIFPDLMIRVRVTPLVESRYRSRPAIRSRASIF